MQDSNLTYQDYEEPTADYSVCKDCGARMLEGQKEWIAEHQFQIVYTCPECGTQEIEYS